MTRAASTWCRIGIQPEVQLINILGGVGGEDRVPAKPGTKVRDLHTRIFRNEMCASLYSTEVLFEFGARLLNKEEMPDEISHGSPRDFSSDLLSVTVTAILT